MHVSSCSGQPCIGNNACSSCQIQTKLTAALCSMQSNIAGQDGGALYMYGDSQLWSQGNTFSNNFANGQGDLQHLGCIGDLLGLQVLMSSTLTSVCPVGGGAWSLENACQQASVGDVFLNNTALLGGAVAFMNPASKSGRQGHD